jgi:hypothetical protein
MDLKNLILIIVAIFNLFLGLLIISKDHKNYSHVYFGLMCVFGGLWTMFMGLLNSITDIRILETYILKFTWICSIFPPLFYILFSLNFPYNIKNQFKLLWLYLIPGLLIFLSLLNSFQVETIYFENNRLVEKTIFDNYLIYAVYFFGYLLVGFFLLSKKYFSESGINKIRIKYILASTFITFLVVTLFSIILPLVNKYFYDWFSPIFTLINFIIIGYLIFLKDLRIKNI